MKISIITVCYNSEKTLQRTIDSIKNQTYKNIEYIFIDGMSQDKTLEIIYKNKKDLERLGITVKIISEKDTGIYNAMNKGISLATGKVIGILNSDDYYSERTLELVNKEIKENDILIGSMYIVRGVKKEKVDSNIKELNKRMSICHPATFIKSNVYKKIGGFDESFKIAGDYDFLSKCYKNNLSIKVIEDILVQMDGGGVSNQTKFLKRIIYENNIVRQRNYNKLNNLVYYIRDYISYILRVTNIRKIFKGEK